MTLDSFSQLILLLLDVGPGDPIPPHHASTIRATLVQCSFDGLADSSLPTSHQDTNLLSQAQEDGAKLQEMIDNPQMACPVNRSNITLSVLDPDAWHIIIRPGETPPQGFFTRSLAALALPSTGYWTVMFSHFCPPSDETDNIWRGRVAPGVIFIEDIERRNFGPWSSELTQLAYETLGPLFTLRTIFVTNVVNTSTRPVAEQIWKDTSTNVCVYGTREYQMLLGTRIGKTIAYFILGAFGQGSRRISRIVIWWAGQASDILQMRFDVEDI
ncbi:hypothetical protein POX_f08275 [Penicillium oxalicum]|uniref:hypothetical protein n=1 Tax=Penicillium oxalicum TaxID=69781 RepID=UPI0020B6AA0B|nr:hypothetical protein POX_f08275 [Penicillium oxalicum]KAI2787893.1 hypothetical protein POX_f08275 [Penicillium oxalicum]